jgi:hypothetical protein
MLCFFRGAIAVLYSWGHIYAIEIGGKGTHNDNI